MRLGIVCFLMLCNLMCHAQQRDSVVLSQVTIYGIPEEKFLTGSAYQGLDSTLQKRLASHHLGVTLSMNFPIYFRSYGNGMISGISLRGTSPQHTAVLWNGLNVNSFSLGQADFSILPVASTDEVSVHSGGGSARFGSGAMGGTVLLNSKIPSDIPLNVVLETGSFGKYFGSFQGTWRLKQWSFRSSLYHQQCENDFKIASSGERQKHAAFQQHGFLQDVQFQISNAQQVELHYWYHKSDRDVQPNANNSNAADEQQDENHRLSLQYKYNGRLGVLFATAGFIHDDLVYNNDPGVVERWSGDLKYQKQLPFGVNTELGAAVIHVVGKLGEYGRDITEDRYDLTASFFKDFGTRLSVSVNLRQPFVTGFHAPFLPYVGVSYDLLEREDDKFSIVASASKNYRIPTLNDRYWPEVGNVNLMPETSNAAETGFRFERRGFSIRQTAFMQVIDQLIKWKFGKRDGRDVWYPENLMQVTIKGIESRIAYQVKAAAFTFNIGANYQFVKSVTSKAPPESAYVIDQQLMYTPKHIAAAHINVEIGKYSFMVFSQYNSKRSTDTANSDLFALDPFATINFSIGRFFVVGQSRFDVQLSALNATDTDYTLYERRAMPGRNYNLQINYKLNRKTE